MHPTLSCITCNIMYPRDGTPLAVGLHKERDRFSFKGFKVIWINDPYIRYSIETNPQVIQLLSITDFSFFLSHKRTRVPNPRFLIPTGLSNASFIFSWLQPNSTIAFLQTSLASMIWSILVCMAFCWSKKAFQQSITRNFNWTSKLASTP